MAEPLVLIGDDGWCLAHCTDDALPRLVNTGCAACAQCGSTTTRATVEGVPLHPRCRRDWKAKKASGAVPKGAYARRRR